MAAPTVAGLAGSAGLLEFVDFVVEPAPVGGQDTFADGLYPFIQEYRGSPVSNAVAIIAIEALPGTRRTRSE